MEDEQQLSRETHLSAIRHSMIMYAGFALAIIGVLGGIVTFTINYANKSDKSKIETPNEPLGPAVPDDLYHFFLNYRYVLIFLFLFSILASIMLYHINAKRRLGSIEHLDHFMVEYATAMAEIQWFSGRIAVSDDNMKEIHTSIGVFLSNSLNRISLLFTKYTGSVCHASIKLYDSSDNTAETVARDNLATLDRWAVDRGMEKQEVGANTAFHTILCNPDADSFCSNHLRLRALFGHYRNPNPKWRKLYHACMVVPLTHERESGQITADTVWGFLIVDNLGAGFDSRHGCSLLRAIGRVYYVIFGQLAQASEAMDAKAISADNYGDIRDV